MIRGGIAPRRSALLSRRVLKGGCRMPVNFDNALAFSDEWVVAIGPEHPREKIEEICVWVYQTLEDGSGDVGATEMTTSHGEHEDAHFVRIDGAARGAPGRWLLPVKKVGHPD